MEYPCIEKNFRDFQRLGSTIRRDRKIQKYVNEEYGNVFFFYPFINFHWNCFSIQNSPILFISHILDSIFLKSEF